MSILLIFLYLTGAKQVGKNTLAYLSLTNKKKFNTIDTECQSYWTIVYISLMFNS
jgi:hypothetical protein